MAGSTSATTQQLRTQAEELIKSYTLFDGVGRPDIIYTAPTDLADGGPCSQVKYEYVNATSSKVLKMKESNATWDATWDI